MTDAAANRFANVMDSDIGAKIEVIERKIDAIFASVEKTRKYFLWALAAAPIGFVLPLIGLLIRHSFLPEHATGPGGAF